MTPVPLLTTKRHVPPVRPELVERPRLIERLNAGLDRKTTLVSAPAGFGKTTLVSEWVQAMGRATPSIAIAWLSLDEADNDLGRFLAYFISALRTVEARQEPAGNIGKGALSALQSPRPPPAEAVLIPLINEIAAIPDRLVLVLDDYHMIEVQAIHDALTFLLDHLPPRMHLVIATRVDPLPPLARLRARGQLTELRATDLRFSRSEVAEFLNQVRGLDLSADVVAARMGRGWLAELPICTATRCGHGCRLRTCRRHWLRSSDLSRRARPLAKGVRT